jgi:hypothetical protein
METRYGAKHHNPLTTTNRRASPRRVHRSGGAAALVLAGMLAAGSLSSIARAQDQEGAPGAHVERAPVAGTIDLATIVRAVTAAQESELSGLAEAIGRATNQAEVLALQRRATHVKLSCRLAIHEAQGAVTSDEDVRSQLDEMSRILRDQIAADQASLPADYAFDPLHLLKSEDVPCAE